MLENVTPEATIPTEGQDTIATEGGAETATPEDSAKETDVSEETMPTDTSHDNEGDAIPEFKLDIKYDKQNRTLSRDEAVNLAQKGLFYENKGIEKLYNKLDYVASLKNTTIEELVDGIILSDEAAYRKSLEEKFGSDGEEVELLLQVYRNGQKDKYEKILADRKENEERIAREQQESLESRLANEFIELKTEFPEITEFKALPTEVKNEAAKGRDLLSCYLRYKHSEDKKIMAAKKTAEENSKATTGSGGSAETTGDSVTAAMLSGLWK